MKFNMPRRSSPPAYVLSSHNLEKRINFLTSRSVMLKSDLTCLRFCSFLNVPSTFIKRLIVLFLASSKSQEYPCNHDHNHSTSLNYILTIASPSIMGVNGAIRQLTDSDHAFSAYRSSISWGMSLSNCSMGRVSLFPLSIFWSAILALLSFLSSIARESRQH